MTDTVGDYSYVWDANKNKTSEAITGVMSPYGFNSAAGQQPAAYDADDRLVGWNRNDGNLDQAWTLTPVGDWDLFTEEAVTQDRSHGPAHEITGVTIGANTNPVQHDVKGNVTFIPAILRGATITDDMTLNWDFDNRLASADTDNGGTADVTFAYDALGRRVRKTTATLDTVFVQAGQQVIADYAAGAAPTSPREKYVYASYIDEPILKDGTLASGTGIVYYHRNQQYSVTALTDASGSVIERYAYDPHGALTILDASGTPLATQQSSVSNRIAYTGRELDIETNLYHFRARLYSPTLGRFLNRDPLEYADGMSLYRAYFVPGMVDPFGRLTQTKSGGFTRGIDSTGCIHPSLVENYINLLCGGYWLETEWQPAGNEKDGFIIQKVCEVWEIAPCRKGRRVVPEGVPGRGRGKGNNGTTCDGCYFELWRVSNGDVFAENIFHKTRPGVPSRKDTFIHFGFKTLTKGRMLKTGEAVFVPFNVMLDITKGAGKKPEKLFPVGPKGVLAAHRLHSACEDKVNEAIPNFWNNLKNHPGVSPPTTKAVYREWDCCGYRGCKNKRDVFEYMSGVSGLYDPGIIVEEIR